MRRVAVLVAVVVLAASASAAVIEIPAMTVAKSHINLGLLPPGATTVGAINAVVAPGAGNMVTIAVPYKGTSTQGVYNTNPIGNALGRLVGGGLGIIAAPTGAFDPFTVDIKLGMNSTEFGMSIGDWIGPMQLTFLMLGAPVGTHLSTGYAAGQNDKYYQSTVAFDQVKFDTSTTGGNFVVPDLHVQVPEPATLSLLALGLLLRRR